MIKLGVTVRTMGFDAVLEPGVGGDVGIRFSNSDELGRFVLEALHLLSGDEILRIGGGCLVTLNPAAAALICDRVK